jgi:glucokinase
VLEIGGTHVTAARVSTGPDPAVLARFRADLDADGPAAAIVAELTEAAARLGVWEPCEWGVAIPGPFDYEAGVGRFESVAKFAHLNGFDLGAALRSSIVPGPTTVTFVNDADAFGIGEWVAGAARYHERSVCLTLGTGVGSAFIGDGVPVKTGGSVPPDGSAHRLTWNGAPLEESVSRRAIRARFADCGGAPLDVREIAELARAGDARALEVFDGAMRALGEAIAPWVESFAATVVVVGGSIARSWDVLGPPFGAGLRSAGPSLADIPVRAAHLPDDAPLIGAAFIHRLD